MLYRVLMRLIERNQIDGLSEKIDVFYATEKLTKEEYEKLTDLLNI